MLSALSHVIHGEPTAPELQLNNAIYLLLVNKNKPLRDSDGKPYSSEVLRQFLVERLDNLELQNFIPVVNNVLDRLSHDEALQYFVLVATLRLSPEILSDSLRRDSVTQGLVSRLHGEYRTKHFASPSVAFGLPRLPWDISSVVSDSLADVDPRPPPVDLHNICAIDSHGLVSSEYNRALQSQELMKSVRQGKTTTFFHFTIKEFLEALSKMYTGTSSDVFQMNVEGKFSQDADCRVGEWPLGMTKAVFDRHILLANRILTIRRKFAEETAKSSKFLHDLISQFALSEIGLFWRSSNDVSEKRVGESDDSVNIPSVYSKIKELPNMGIWEAHEYAENFYNIAKSHYDVLVAVAKLSDDSEKYTVIELHEIAKIGSIGAVCSFSRLAWRRLSLHLTRAILHSIAKSLSSTDANLREIFVTVDEKDLTKLNNSVWQRLNVLRLPTSRFVSTTLSTRIADLVIEFQTLATHTEYVYLACRRVGSTLFDNLNDFDVVHFFGLSHDFDSIVSEVMSEIDDEDSEEELEKLIDLLLRRLPTVDVLDRFSSLLFADALCLVDFARHVFVKAHCIVGDVESSQQTNAATTLHRWLVSCGFDDEMTKWLTIHDDKTSGGYELRLVVPSPLSVFMSRAYVARYSHLHSLMCLYQRALEALLLTDKCEAMRETRLRNDVNHMRTSVFFIRNTMLQHAEDSFKTFKENLSLLETSSSMAQKFDKMYSEHRRLVRAIDAATMLSANRSAAGPILRMMVDSIVSAAYAIVNYDVMSEQIHYQKFVGHLQLFIDQCSIDRDTIAIYSRLAPDGILTNDDSRATSIRSSFSGLS